MKGGQALQGYSFDWACQRLSHTKSSSNQSDYGRVPGTHASSGVGLSMDEQYDAIVLGTGLTECIISGLVIGGWLQGTFIATRGAVLVLTTLHQCNTLY